MVPFSTIFVDKSYFLQRSHSSMFPIQWSLTKTLSSPLPNPMNLPKLEDIPMHENKLASLLL